MGDDRTGWALGNKDTLQLCHLKDNGAEPAMYQPQAAPY